MRRSKTPTILRCKPQIFVAALVLCLCGLQGQAMFDEARPSGVSPLVNEPAQAVEAASAKRSIASEEGSQAQRAYVDPVTGEFVVPTATERAAEAFEAGLEFSTSHEGLVETASSVTGGGVMVDLQDRFRSPLRATFESDNSLVVSHETAEQASREKE